MIAKLYKELLKLQITVDVVDEKLRVDAPKGVITPELLQEIKVHKDELIHFILTYKNKNKSHAIIPKVADQEGYELSSSQKRLWILNQFENDQASYVMFNTLSFKGKVKVAVFQKAIGLLIKRHEILRTIFKKDSQGNIKQYVMNDFSEIFTICTYDLRKEKLKKEQAHQKIYEQQEKPFNLDKFPLLRVSLFRLEDKEWLFNYTIHHIISDEWSIRMLIKELLSIYNCLINKKEIVLEPLRIQYKDYAAWQQKKLHDGSFKKQKEYWYNQFHGKSTLLKLPQDKSGSAFLSQQRVVVNQTFDQSITRQLKEICLNQKGTLFMGLLSIVNTLLYKYTNECEITVGSPIASREHEELEQQLGCYINIMGLRTVFKPSEDFIDLFASVKKVVLAAYTHRSYPFDQLISDLQLKRKRGKNVLFNVFVTLQNIDLYENSQVFDGIEIAEYPVEDRAVNKFDLSFTFAESNGEISFSIAYDKELFSTDLCTQFTNHFVQLTKVILANPTCPLKDIVYLTKREKKEIVYLFNNTESDYPRNKTIVQIFQEQAAIQKSKPAIFFENTIISYATLDQKSDRFAAYLMQKYEVKNNELIAIKLQRTPWVLISVLGILKTGCAYVPLDSKLPDSRIDYILSDSKSRLVIDEEEINSFQKVEHDYRKTPFVSRSQPNELAYIIYTSGTTGLPKGVMIENKSLVARIHYFQKMYALTAIDNILFYRSYSFDGAIEEYILPVLVGAQCIIAKRGFNLDLIHNMIDMIHEHKITKVNMPPVLLLDFVEYLDKEVVNKLTSLKHIVSGGDILTLKIVQEVTARLDVHLYNSYGPTENTIDSTNVNINSLSDKTIITIGKPVPNSKVYILDDQMQVVPKGVFGELYVSGDGLARGYVNNPELTKEKFIDNPFGLNEKMYKTGDIGRWLLSGHIEFKGRKDNQVKIRGHRIELGEIKTVLEQHTRVHQAAVDIIENQNEKSIIAYIVPIKESTIREMKEYIRTVLPEYMIPNFFVFLDHLPLNSNGKIDKSHLINHEMVKVTSETPYVAPGNSTEEIIVGIWEELLNLKTVGVQHDFWDIGGDSLKLIKLHYKLEKAFEKKIPIHSLLDHTTIKQFSVYLDEKEISGNKSQHNIIDF